MEELFKYDGTFVSVVSESGHEGVMVIKYWDDGRIVEIPYENLESATPEDLEEIA